MIKLDKKLVDKVIRLSEKFFETRDSYDLEALAEASYALKEKATWEVTDLLTALARYTQESGNGTHDDIYKALAVFGIIVEDNMNDILVVEKMKSFSIPKNDFNYYLKLSNNTVILVTKEEFHSNKVGTKVRLESEVEYK